MVYGNQLYGTSQYGIDQQDEEQVEISAPELMKYLPDYYENSHVMKEFQKSLAQELGALKYGKDEVLRQFFLETATWGLDIWEQELGLTTDLSKTYVTRREIISAKIKGTGTTTKEKIIKTAAVFSGGEVDVVEYPSEYRFEVHFVGTKGIPPNMPGFIQMLEEIKPAHLTYTFKYNYTVWNTVGSLTWDQIKMKTWNEIRIYEGL